KIGVDASYERCRNDRAALELIGRHLWHDRVGQIAEFRDVLIEESLLSDLPVRVAVGAGQATLHGGGVEIECAWGPSRRAGRGGPSRRFHSRFPVELIDANRNRRIVGSIIGL